MSFKKIMAPTDFSEASIYGIRKARELASLVDGEVVILFVEEPVWDSDLPAEVREMLEGYQTTFHSQADERLKELVKTELEGVDGSYQIVQGHAFTTIIDYAQRNGVDIICMATQGWGNPARAHTGSVTERVVRNSTLPVFVVPLPGEEEVTRPMGVVE